MKRLSDYDEFGQGIPKNKQMSDLETGRSHTTGPKYATLEELQELEKALTTLVEGMASKFVLVIQELQQIKLHLASMSNAEVDESDTEVNN